VTKSETELDALIAAARKKNDRSIIAAALAFRRPAVEAAL
jgi:hypothetical protein